MNEILVYAKYDDNKSIVAIRSNIFLDDTTGWTQIDEWTEGQDRYLYAHADNGDYIQAKKGASLFDDKGRPNFHDDFVKWTDAKKEELYPIPEPEPSEIELLKEQQEVTAQAVQDLILLTLGGE